MKKYLQAVGIWILIIPLAILNGGLREYFLVRLGSIALPLSGLILSSAIFIAARLLVPRISGCKRGDYVFFGILWCLLTNLFELGMLLMEGGSPADYLKTFYFPDGNLWALVVLSTLLAPILAPIAAHQKEIKRNKNRNARW